MHAIDCCEFSQLSARHRWADVADFMSDNNGTTSQHSVRIDPSLWPEPPLADTLLHHLAEAPPKIDPNRFQIRWLQSQLFHRANCH